MNCPICRSVIPEQRILKGVVYCECGWEPERTNPPKSYFQSNRLSIFIFGAFATALVFGFLLYFQWRPYTLEVAPLLLKAKMNNAGASDYMKIGSICNTLNKDDCSIDAYSSVLKLDSQNEAAVSNLAMAYARNAQHEKAIEYFQKLTDMGGGAADSYYWFAKSSAMMGDLEKSVKYAYHSLSLSPGLLDALELQIQNLLQLHRPEEALSLVLATQLHFPKSEKLFQSKVISISEVLQKQERPVVEQRFPFVSSHAYIPLRFNDLGFHTFLYDTGASVVQLSTKLVNELGLDPRQEGKITYVQIANGQRIPVRNVKIPKLWVGSIEVHDVDAVYCDGCDLLMGQTLNSRFESSVQKSGDSDFLTLRFR